MINWTETTVPLSALKPWERNPKTISKTHAKRLLANWQELGQWQTIAIGPGGEVYDGHQRLSVLKAAYGADYVVKALQSDRALTDDERGRIAVACGKCKTAVNATGISFQNATKQAADVFKLVSK